MHRANIHRNEQRHAHGFTLIEVMIVVAIVAILAAVALPSYNDYVRRGTLPEAFSTLSDYRVKLEQYYQDKRNYGTGGECADGAAGPIQVSPSGNHFTFACALTNGGQGYVLTATGSAGRATGHVYTITSNNAKATTLFKGASVAKPCWLVKGGEC
jgi:type IV pilus assembly protein PilE